MNARAFRRLIDPDDWTLHAACRGEGHLFFAPDDVQESRAERWTREELAKAVCAVCDVRAECLAQAIADDERTGIWGGLNARERRAVSRQQPHPHDDIAGPGRLARLPAVVVQGRPMSPSGDG